MRAAPGDQHDAFSIAARLSHADRDGSLAAFLNPDLSPPERTVAQVEGWILGVPGLIRSGKGALTPPRRLLATLHLIRAKRQIRLDKGALDIA